MAISQFLLNGAATGFLLDPSSPDSGLIGTSINGLPVWSAYQTAAHIARPGGTWADYAASMDVSYSFSVGATTIPAGYEAFSSLMAQDGARLAMQLYSDVSGIRFHESTDVNVADISFIFGIGSANGGGWANYPSGGGGNHIQVGHVSWEPAMVAGSYSLNLLLHELGHGVGLAHPGDYNGNTAVYANADHYNDSDQYTNMSYWSETFTGASFSHLATLGLHDILAVQMEYGVNWSARATDTVYGFNATAGSQSYDFGFDSTMGFSIWDGGGADTLDFSGFSSNTVMDLRQGSFSSTGLETYNVSIAYGAVIENATGGRGDDRIIGNTTANVLRGGDGNDTIFGGSEADVVVTVNPRDFIGVQLNEAPQTFNQYLKATGVTQLSGSQFTVEELVQLTRVAGTAAEFLSYNVAGNDNQLIIEGAADGTIDVTIRNKAAYHTGIKTETLVDGNPHRLSLSYDSPTGTVSLYIDGTLVHSGIYTAAKGLTLTSGGTLVFGQEQDSPGGGFDIKQVFQGTIGDLRIFNDIRTAQEVADNAFTKLTGTEQGLVRNWQVHTGDTTAITDIVSGGGALTVFNGATVVNTAPVIDLTPDNDTLIGGGGNDHLYGGAGNDVLLGDTGSAGYGAVYGLDMNATGSAQNMHLNGMTGMPTTALTLEFEVNYHAAPGYQWFFSLPGISLLMDPGNSGAPGLWLLVNGSWTYSQISAAQLGDGQGHRISFSWDNATGAYAHYLDGALVKSGTGFNVGAVLPGTGNITITPLVGAIGDVRLYDHVLTAAEIAATAPGPLVDPVNTAGLVLNWQTTAGGIVIDAHGGTAPIVTGSPTTVVTVTAATTFNDILEGGIGNDTLDGGQGDDTLLGGLGADQLIGGAGSDTASYADAASGLIVALGAPGSNTGEANGDTYNSIENLTGSAFADLLIGDGIANILSGGGGNDLLSGGLGNDTLNGGAGSDTADYTDATNDLQIVLDVPGGATVNAGALGTDTLIAIENLNGGTGNDTLVGNALTNILTGGGGNDVLTGNDGDDVLKGGLGNDTLNGGVGIDTADLSDASNDLVVILDAQGNTTVDAGAAGIDTLVAIESVIGGAGNDTLTGNDSDNTLRGGGGNDTLTGGLGVDTADLSDATSRVALILDASGHDVITATGSGTDTLNGIENVTSGSGDDILNGNSAANVLTGNSGNDILVGNSGNDTYYGGDGGDVISELTVSTFDNDTIYGGNGADIIYANFGDDVVYGGTDTANNYLNLGDGADTASGSEGTDVVLGGNGDDTITGNGGSDSLYGEVGNDTIYGGAGIDLLSGDVGDDKLYGGADNDLLVGDAGNDTLDGGAAVDVLYGGTGLDAMYGGLGNDYVDGGDGNDTMYGGDGTDTMLGDLETVNGGDDLMYGDAGDDIMLGYIGNDTMFGGDGNDRLYGVYDNDTLDGGAGNDDVYGGTGNDVLSGGAGLDQLYGGAGNDDFRWAATGYGAEFIWDFSGGAGASDRLSFAASVFANEAAVRTASVYSSGNTTITASDGSTIVLVGINIANLNSDDFVFF
jgi:Ca2+-binding RTX toxin-like protein